MRGLQKYVINPPVRALFALGVAPPFYAVLETTGRKSGRPRRTPVGNGLDGDTFWLITELGHRMRGARHADRRDSGREGRLADVLHRLEP